MRTTWAIVVGIALAQAAWADTPGEASGLEGLAPPGACAESRTLRGDPEQGFDADAFDVAGGPRDHFDPMDVGAGGGDAGGFRPPDAPRVTRGPCEGPTAGCSEVFAPRQGGVVVTEPDPGAGDGPVFGGRP